MSETKQRIRGWERELIIGVVIILLALLKVMFDVSLSLRAVLAIAGVAALALAVFFLARRISPAFDERAERWWSDRRVWYGALSGFIAVAVLALSIRVEDLESTVTDQGEEMEQARVTETAQVAEATALRAALVEQEQEAQTARSTLASRESALPQGQATSTAQATATEPPPTATDTLAPTATPAAADSVWSYWARVGQGDYGDAWDMLSLRFQSDRFARGFDQYQQGMRDWLDTLCHMEVARVKAGPGADGNSAQVDVIMVYQVQPDCATVTHAFEYHLTRGTDSDWKIDQVKQLD